MTRFGYPVSLDVGGKRAVVVGDARGKADALRAAGAEVSEISLREFGPKALDGAFVCVASSGDPAEREAIFRACRERGVLVNVMDDPVRCDFAAPAVVRRGDLTIAVSTSGRSPALSGPRSSMSWAVSAMRRTRSCPTSARASSDGRTRSTSTR